METEDIKDHQPSLWLPERNQMLLAALAKLGEEAGELSSIVCRCIAQGVDGVDPETGKPNRLALQDEIADVRALSSLVADMLDLDYEATMMRVAKKREMKQKWIFMIKDHYHPETKR